MLIKAFGRSIKVDNVAVTLSCKARVVGSWSTKKLPHENTFFVACLPNEVVQILVSLDHIRGEGFALVVNYFRDQSIDATLNKLRFKVCASLLNLPLIC